MVGQGRYRLGVDVGGTHTDLVLLDVNMPVMNGEETLARLRQNPETADLPVVIVSTEGSDTRIAALRELGAEFVHKPFSPEKLLRTVDKVCP